MCGVALPHVLHPQVLHTDRNSAKPHVFCNNMEWWKVNPTLTQMVAKVQAITAVGVPSHGTSLRQSAADTAFTASTCHQHGNTIAPIN